LIDVQQQIFHAYSWREQINNVLKLYINEGGMWQLCTATWKNKYGELDGNKTVYVQSLSSTIILQFCASLKKYGGNSVWGGGGGSVPLQNMEVMA
jgi:hypothetical protein